MTRKRRRLVILVLFLLGLGTATALSLLAFQDSLVFFFSPSDLMTNRPIAPDRAIRVGGLVLPGSVERGPGTQIRFIITDGTAQVPVGYSGILPDLFREGQGVVASGRLDPGGTFRASEILAKHDENYMPREVADALRRSGHWQGETPPTQGSPAQGSPAQGSPAQGSQAQGGRR